MTTKCTPRTKWVDTRTKNKVITWLVLRKGNQAATTEEKKHQSCEINDTFPLCRPSFET